MAKMKELFAAYRESDFPTDGGFIVSSFFDENSTYTRYEAVSYSNVKDIYASENSLTFQAEGAKVYILVEPRNYAKKHIEPAYREAEYQIPYRFKELEIHTSARDDRIMIAKEPVISYSAFTILQPTGNNFSYLFYYSENIVAEIQAFFADSFRKDARIPLRDSDKAAAVFASVFKKIVIPPVSN
ncbi:MAG: transposase [Spirochaetaceae bacterium]|nr:MAG: transposase [Spirochaetaceae bacterium]